ncbi:MAG: ATP-binding protein [Hyphomicrobium sp.]
MKRILPQTLFGQTLLILLFGIGFTLLAGGWIYSTARQEAVRAVGALASAERIINLSRFVGEVPAEWRQRLVSGSNDASFSVKLSPQRPLVPTNGSDSQAAAAIAEFLKAGLPSSQVSVAVTTTGDLLMAPGFHHGAGFGLGFHGRFGTGPMMQGPLARAAMSWRGLQVAVQLGDGQWLNFSTSLPDTGPAISPWLLFTLLLMAAMIAFVTAWAVRRMTAPLGILADAAARLGRNVDTPPLVGAGSIEMRRASDAFNEMQARLRRLVENRTLMLAAISHDLRTQLTLLRLRAEAAEEVPERDRMLKTIADMENMLTATLSFARDEAASEDHKRADVSALLASIIDDMADAGFPVTVGHIDQAIIIECKSMALRRALTNLIDNAIKYGTTARAYLRATSEEIEFTIEDDGPGIPVDQLKDVLQPFYRVEGSRSRDTGGIGLGLAIAASIAEAHGGELRLANRPEGGLSAILVLPR